MAIYHCSIKIGSRANGQSAIAAAAYRAGDNLKDKETGLVSDYSRKGGVVFSEISLCQNAPAEYADRATLWNAVHEIEKAKNSQLWREFEVALPQEFSRAEQIDTVRGFVKGLTKQGMCVDWSLHDKEDGNPHAHIMATMRSITEGGKWAPKSRKVYDLDENGERIFQKVDKSGRKQYKNHKEDYNDWNKKERVEEWRAAWAACCNERLAERDRIDHRSYKRQGIEQEPTIHEGYAARKIAAEGKPSERVRINEEIRERNNMLKQLAEQLHHIEQQLAELIKEKGSAAINAGKQRIADLLARRSRAVDSDDRGLADGERTTESRTERTTATEADRLIRESEAERRAALRNVGLEESGRTAQGNEKKAEHSATRLQPTEQPDTAAIFGAADSLIQDTDTNQEAVRAATADTDSTIRQSETKVTSAAAHRQERELAEQRRAAEERRRAEEAERKARAASERARKTSYDRGR
ncbi:MobQ family relaxase [Ruminococcus albus]|uniref:MobQ family relaxase n=1 Tax=Ruminococcus albus TaxID=1264 RepID=UPI0001E0E71A|nr:MobQ family relaxase [Ruminococcus albus]